MELVIRVARISHLPRLLYYIMIVLSFLFLGAGDLRAFLLTLTLTLVYAGLVEHVMMVSEALGTLLLASGLVVAFASFYLLEDLPSRLYIALCVLIGLVVLAIIKYEIEGR
jgi:hypothetical protein